MCMKMCDVVYLNEIKPLPIQFAYNRYNVPSVNSIFVAKSRKDTHTQTHMGFHKYKRMRCNVKYKASQIKVGEQVIACRKTEKITTTTTAATKSTHTNAMEPLS